MDKDDDQMRERLVRAWMSVVARLETSEFPIGLIYETLAEVVVDGMADLNGAAGVSALLRLRADALDARERRTAEHLIAGR